MAIINSKYKIDASKLIMEDIFLVYPSLRITQGIVFKPFLCSLNIKKGSCIICKRKILDYNFCEMGFVGHLSKVMEDTEELCYAISHWKKIRTPKTLTALLRLLFQTPSYINCYRYLEYFAIEEGSEMEETIITEVCIQHTYDRKSQDCHKNV